MMTHQPLTSILSKLIAIALMAVSALAQEQDNYKTSASVTKRSTNVSGVHTDHFILDSGSVTTVESGSTAIASGQATLSTTASIAVPAAATRRAYLIRNHDASISIYVGAAGVTSSNGFLVKAGEAISVNSRAALYAVAASGTPVVSWLAENN